MTWSAPSERTSSTLRVLQTPVTSAPKCFAICTANVPTPPDAPLISTFCPGLIPPLSRRPCSAVSAATGTDAACSNVTFAGLSATRAALANDDVLRDRAVRAAEHFVARLEARDALADGFDRAGEVDADARVLRRAEAGRQSHDVRRAAHGVPVDRVQRGGVHLHEQLIVRGRRLGDLFELRARPVRRSSERRGLSWTRSRRAALRVRRKASCSSARRPARRMPAPRRSRECPGCGCVISWLCAPSAGTMSAADPAGQPLATGHGRAPPSYDRGGRVAVMERARQGLGPRTGRTLVYSRAMAIAAISRQTPRPGADLGVAARALRAHRLADCSACCSTSAIRRRLSS